MALLLLALMVVVTIALHLNFAEREVIAQAIAEAKEHGRKTSVAREASIQAIQTSRIKLTRAQVTQKDP